MHPARPCRLRLGLPAAALIALGAAGLTAPASRAELHRWVDDTGVVRYTTSRQAIPSSYRDEAQPVRAGMPDLSEPQTAAEPAPEAQAPPAPGSLPSVIGASVPDPSGRLGDAGLPAPGPTAVADAEPGDAAPAEAADPGPDLEARIRALEEAIARDEEALKDLISTPPAEGEEGIERSQELREIARRLPGMQAELRALKHQQALQGP